MTSDQVDVLTAKLGMLALNVGWDGIGLSTDAYVESCHAEAVFGFAAVY